MLNKIILEGLYYIVKMFGYIFNRIVSWIGVLKNIIKMFNFIFFVQY